MKIKTDTFKMALIAMIAPLVCASFGEGGGGTATLYGGSTGVDLDALGRHNYDECGRSVRKKHEWMECGRNAEGMPPSRVLGF